MSEGGFVSRGFGGRRRTPDDLRQRLPPGQYLERDFPVLTAGPTPQVETGEWSLKIDGMVANPSEWSWEEFNALPQEEVPCDIHCVTKWSKLDTSFRGVSLDTLFEAVEPLDAFAMAYSYGGYTTNHAIEDLSDGKAWVVTEHEGEPLPREHGGPVRVITPQLYAWKGAKWVTRLEFLRQDQRGFWEVRGYSNTAHPWRNDRYS